jgi:hypothetical protein
VASVFCGPTAAQTAPAAGLSLLSWEIQDVRDAMTDKVTRMAVSKANFSDGTTLEASAKCDEIGIEFAFGTFSNKDPLPLSASGKEIQLRVRTDNGDTRIVRADRQYTNQAKTLFYDPDTSRAVLARSVRAPGGDSPMEKALTGWMADSTINEVLAKLAQNSLGTTDALTKAGSVRVELTLADGRTDVFDLNPQDQTLKALVQQCASGLHTDRRAGRQEQLKVTCETATANSDNTQKDEPIRQGIFPVDKQETGNQTGRTWYHITVDGRNFWIKEQPCVTLLPQAAQRSGELAPSLPFAEPKDVTLVHPTQIYLSANDSRGITAKGKVTILGQSQFTNGFYCIVRVQIDKQYKTGLIGIDILGAALEPSQSRACYMPHGAGGIELTTAN